MVVLIVVVGGGATAKWQLGMDNVPSGQIVLLGTTDIRESHLAFRVSDRLEKMLVDEGDWVEQGQQLAQLDTTLLSANLDEATAMAESTAQTLARLNNGSRPEDIDFAQATLNEAVVQYEDAQRKLAEVLEMQSQGVSSKREIESTQAAKNAAGNRVQALKASLILLQRGPRAEDIAAAKAQHEAAVARVAIARQRLTDAQLMAPSSGVIRARLHEPGEMVGPTTPVLLLAQTDPIWVRVYLDETDLGRTTLGMKAQITIDSHPGRIFDGWLGSISPTAEFTPKPVATARLRTSLVYQARVFVRDPDRIFKLGMPATVTLLPDEKGIGSSRGPTE